MDAQPLAAERRAERRQDQREAGRRVRRHKPVGQPVQPGQLAAGRGVDLLPGHQRHHVIGVHLLRKHVGHDPAAPEHHDPVGQAKHLIDVVAGEQDRRAPLTQAGDQLLHLGSLDDAQRRGRLVEQQHPGLAGHRTRHGHHLALAAGERPHSPGGVRQRDVIAAEHRLGGGVETDVGQQLPAPLPAEQQVRGDIQVLAEREVLPDDRDPLARDRQRNMRNGLAIEHDLPARRPHVTRDAAHQGGLARPVLPSQGDKLARPDREVDAVQCPDRAEPDREPRHREQRPGRLRHVPCCGSAHWHILTVIPAMHHLGGAADLG